MYDADGDLYPFWHSSQQRDPGYGLALFYNKDLDTKLENARNATSLDIRAENLRDAGRIIVDQAPAVFLYQQQTITAHRSAVRGISDKSTVGVSSVYAAVSGWYVKTTLAWR